MRASYPSGKFASLDAKLPCPQVDELTACTSVPGLLEAILKRLEANFTHIVTPALEGDNVICAALRAIGCSRSGLVASTELRDILGLSSRNHNLAWSTIYFNLKPLLLVRFLCVFPPSVCSCLTSRAFRRAYLGHSVLSLDCTRFCRPYKAHRRQLRCQYSRPSLFHLLQVRSGCCTFLHDHVRVAIERRYLPDFTSRLRVHRLLASYFHGVPSPLLPGVDVKPQPLYLDTGVPNQRMLVRFFG